MRHHCPWYTGPIPPSRILCSYAALGFHLFEFSGTRTFIFQRVVSYSSETGQSISILVWSSLATALWSPCYALSFLRIAVASRYASGICGRIWETLRTHSLRNDTSTEAMNSPFEVTFQVRRFCSNTYLPFSSTLH